MYSATTLTFILATLAQTASAALVSQIAYNGQCLTVSNPNAGAAVTLSSCDSANSNQGTQTNQRWEIQEGNNRGVQLFGTDLCLDAQTPPAPGRPTLVYPCNGAAPQTWYLTFDNRIAITGGTQCLTVLGSSIETQNCAPGIDLQVFTPTLLFDTTSSSSSSSGSGSSTASSTNGGIIGGGVGSVSSSVASVTSQLGASASSAVSQLTSSLASISSSISSANAGASQSASSAVSSATASASSQIAGASSSASSAIASASSMVSMATASRSGTNSQSSQGALGSAISAATSAASAATSAAAAVTSAARSGAGSSLPNFGLPAIASLFGIALGAMLL